MPPKNEAATGTVGKEMARKLSITEFGYNKPELQKLVIGDQTNRHHLVRFVGIAQGLKPYRNKNAGDREGEIMYGLIGQFEGTSSGGEVKDGTVLYLPGYVNEAIAAVLQAGDIEGVRIAYDIYAQYDESSATSYVFSVFDLLNTGAESVQEVKSAIASLPMPAKVAALPAPDA